MSRPLNEIAEQTETLFHVSEIDSYNDWIFSFLRPLLGRRVLEVGCGIGTYTARIVAVTEQLVALDPVPVYAARVRRGLGREARVPVTIGALPEDAGFRPRSFDTIVCLNVVEHLEDPERGVATMLDWLAPGGALFVQVPAHQFLFGSVDVSLGHYRRYTAASLGRLLRDAGLDVVLGPRYLYALAIPGWWLVGRALRRRAVPASGVRVARTLVRLSRAVEDRVALPFGLTLIAAARLPDARR